VCVCVCVVKLFLDEGQAEDVLVRLQELKVSFCVRHAQALLQTLRQYVLPLATLL
jgi:hypothetical protein